MPTIRNSLVIIGKTWFQRTYGNTYHSVIVIVDGMQVWNSGIHYGYGSAYEQTAREWLRVEGYLDGLETYPSGGNESLNSFCRKRAIPYVECSIPVRSRKDL